MLGVMKGAINVGAVFLSTTPVGELARVSSTPTQRPTCRSLLLLMIFLLNIALASLTFLSLL